MVFNLQAYAARIGYAGSMDPTLETLRGLAERHVSSVPFENLNVLLGLPVELSPAALEGKLVGQRRGGYCFEQNGLMLGVLEQIGFEVRPLSGRVRIDLPREITPPRTHLFILVTIEGEEWFFDVGVGGMSLTSPIRFRVDEEQATLHEARRIVNHDGRYFHQAWMGKDWADIYEFTGETMPVVDREVGNWWTSTNPTSKFANNLFAARAEEDGVRLGLFNDRLTWRRGPEVLDQRVLGSVDEVVDVLAGEFGLAVPDGAAVERLYRPS